MQPARGATRLSSSMQGPLGSEGVLRLPPPLLRCCWVSEDIATAASLDRSGPLAGAAPVQLKSPVRGSEGLDVRPMVYKRGVEAVSAPLLFPFTKEQQ